MVRGLSARSVKATSRQLSDEAIAALQSGDPMKLIELHRAEFGGFRMEDDNSDGGDDNADDDNTGGDSGDNGGDDNNDDDDDDSSGGGDDNDTVSKADFDKLMARMKAADKRATEAQNKLKEIDDAKKSDLERAQSELEESKSEAKTLREQLQSERLNNAFLSANKHTWHKPSAALKLAQSEGFLEDVVGEDGTVDSKALSAALDKLAREHSYLVKPREGAGPSGDSAGGRSNNGKDDKVVKEQDRRRAPALRRRG